MRFLLLFMMFTLLMPECKSSQSVESSQRTNQSSIEKKKWLSLAVSQPDEWYATNEAKEVAENVLLYQRNIGGWPKNIEMHHKLTDKQKAEIVGQKEKTDAIFDNGATTTEMRFLGKMYKAMKDPRYKDAVNKAIDFIIAAQYDSNYKGEGGWPQVYPLREKGYTSRITFNDDAMIHLLEILRKVYHKADEFSDIVDDATATKAKISFDKGVQCILNCQVTENGVKTFWGAQHDEHTLLPAVARPKELPSYSGSEGTRILQFLMELENPSQEIKDAVVAAAEGLEKVKIPNKKVVNVTENGILVDRKVIDSPGDDMWGRFIQIGGKVGQEAFDALVNGYLKKGSKGGFSYRENALSSYDPTKTSQPIYSIYEADRPNLLYRYLYIFEDAEPVDINGVSTAVSLDAKTRIKYQYLGNWPQKVLRKQYPAWRKKNGLD